MPAAPSSGKPEPAEVTKKGFWVPGGGSRHLTGAPRADAVPGRVGAWWHLGPPGFLSCSAATQTGQIGSAGRQEGWHGHGENCRTCRSGVGMEKRKAVAIPKTSALGLAGLEFGGKVSTWMPAQYGHFRALVLVR